MSLLKVRKRFLTISKRTDLVDPATYADSGADAFLNEAQRKLDRMVSTRERLARHSKTFPANSAWMTLEGCFAIHEVWIANSSGRTKLEYNPWSTFREDHPSLMSTITEDVLPSTMGVTVNDSTGQPSEYTITVVRRSPKMNDFLPDQWFKNSTEFDSFDTIFGDPYGIRGIVWAPPMDSAYTVTVLGGFYSRVLSSDEDMSYWTMEEPETLVHMACYLLELSYRNHQGAAMWMDAIKADLGIIDLGVVDEDFAQVSEMEG